MGTLPSLSNYWRDVATGIPVPDIGYTSTQDPQDMAQQNRDAARAWGQGLDQAIRDQGNIYQNKEEAAFNAGWDQYSPILGGEGGFTPQEQQDILQRNLTTGGMATPEQLNQQFLSAEEQRNIMGNPWAPRDFASGQVDRVDALQQEGAQRRNEAEAWNTAALLDAANDPRAQVGGGFKDELAALNAQRAAGYGDILDPANLTVRPEFFNAGDAALGDLESDYDTAIDPNNLRASSDFMRDYNFSPADEQAMISAAGRSVGLRGAAERDALERAAFQAGNVNPLAVQAAAARNQLQSDIGAADAMNRARIGARQLGLNTAAGRENVRLGAEQALSGAQAAAASDLAGRRLGQLNTGEQMRIGAEQGLADRELNAWQDVSNVGNQNAQMYEMLRLDNAQKNADRATQAANIAGQGKMATAAGNAASQLQTGQWGANMLSGMTEGAEREASDRAGSIAANRQSTGGANIDTRFGQGVTAGGALSGRFQDIYGQQKREEQEGRGWLAGQQDAAQQGNLTSTDQRLSAGGTQLSGINAPLNAAISSKYIPTALDKGVGFGLSALDSFSNFGG